MQTGHRRPPPSTLPPAGLKDTGHLINAADCLRRDCEPRQPAATAYEEQCRGAARGGARSPPPVPRSGGAGSDGVGRCLQPGPTDPFLQELEEVQEATYRRNKLEPLGRPRSHGTALPEGLGTIRAFGVAVHARELELNNQGKRAIYPGGGEEAEGVHEQYVRSHRDFAPGEQRKYGFDFQGADPAALCFGKPPNRSTGAELRAALQPGVPPDLEAMSERLQRFSLMHRPALGVPHSPNAMERDLPPGHTYGRPPTKGEPGADQVLRGSYSSAEQQPDPDLGKPRAPGAAARRGLGREDSAQQAPAPGPAGAPWSNVATNAAASPSLTAATGGGSAGPRGGAAAGAVTATQLLRPIDSVYRGVTEDHFRQPRSRQEMWELVAASGILQDRQAFECIYDAAAGRGGNFGCCSLEGFIQARMELLKEERGLRP